VSNVDAVWVRGVNGIQMHHVTDLQDAGRFLGNAAMALRAAHVRTGADRYSSMAAELKGLVERVRRLEDEARSSMHDLHSTDPERFARCRDGHEPWPGEIEAGFIPRHTCKDQCLYHDHGVVEASCSAPAAVRPARHARSAAGSERFRSPDGAELTRPDTRPRQSYLRVLNVFIRRRDTP
jgi:hypothetical protein